MFAFTLICQCYITSQISDIKYISSTPISLPELSKDFPFNKNYKVPALSGYFENKGP